MDTKQETRVTMFKTVAEVLDQNNSVWNGMPALVTAVQQFKQIIEDIETAAQKQDSATAGTVEDKTAARDALEDVLFLTCEALGVLGHMSNDNALVTLTALTPSDLLRLSDEELSNRATSILQQANAKKTELAGLQVTQANIDELEQALQTFRTAKEKPRAATTERMVQTESLPSLIREASNILRNQIDRLVNLYRRSNAGFVARYKNARVIVDRAASHSATKTQASAPTANP